MDVKVTCQIDEEIVSFAVHDDEYEIARDEASALVPEGAQRMNIFVV